MSANILIAAEYTRIISTDLQFITSSSSTENSSSPAGAHIKMGLNAREREEFNSMKEELIAIKALLKEVVTRSNKQTTALKASNAEVVALTKQLNDIRCAINTSNYKADAQEQHGRLESFRINDAKETESLGSDGKVQNREDCEKVVIGAAAAIGVELKPEDIQRVHRVGKLKANPTKPRQIICKLKSWKKRCEIIFKKKTLSENSNFKDCFITEDLTPLRSKLLWYAKKHCNGKFVKVHTRDGVIKAKLSTNPDAKSWIALKSPDCFHKHNVDVDLTLINKNLHTFQVLADIEVDEGSLIGELANCWPIEFKLNE